MSNRGIDLLRNESEWNWAAEKDTIDLLGKSLEGLKSGGEGWWVQLMVLQEQK